MVTRAIERAQRQVEAQNFSTRKHLLEYDDVMNRQRENIYGLRRQLLEGRITIEDGSVDSREYVMTLADNLVASLVDTHANRDTDPEEWDLGGLARAVSELFGIEPEAVDAIKLDELSPDDMAEQLFELAKARYDLKEKDSGVDPALLRRVERDIMLQIVDAQWKDHLYALDHLKEGIGLRGYGQRDPLVEYKRESFALYEAMMGRIDEEIVRYLWRLRPVVSPDGEAASPVRRPAARRPAQMTLGTGPAPSPLAGAAAAPGGAAPRPARTGGDDAKVKTVRRDEPKIGRNDPCFCGSGKKYKKCHGA